MPGLSFLTALGDMYIPQNIISSTNKTMNINILAGELISNTYAKAEKDKNAINSRINAMVRSSVVTYSV